MPEFFTHSPVGDHNPYEPAATARMPLDPHDTDTITVGVTTTGPADRVAIEWDGTGGTGTVEMVRHDDAWSASIGPFPDSVAYRFRGRETDGDEHHSPWIPLPVVSWSDERRARLEIAGSSLRVSTDEPIAPVGQVPVPGLSAQVGTTDGSPTHLRLTWELRDDEALFGTGERYDTLDQRGEHRDVRVYEQYKGQGSRTYFPVPWICSNRGYGIRFADSERLRFDLGATEPNVATVSAPVTDLTATCYSGSLAELVQAYAADIGLPPVLPPWVFGPWMSGNEWDRQATVDDVVDRTVAEGIPATVLVIEAWSDEATFYVFNDAAYEPRDPAAPWTADGLRHSGRWPDPKAMIDRLHDHDIRVVLWQIPVLKDLDGHPQHDADVAHASTSDFCVTTDDGADYRNRGWWFPESRIIDFTNPDARAWWMGKRRYLVSEYGIDGFKTDGGEHLWGGDVILADGSTGDVAANEYPNHYLRTYHELLDDESDEQLLTFSRAGFAGSQRYPAHWAGDEDSTWEAFRASITAGLTSAMSAISFWAWDLGGFSGPLPSAELYRRSTQAAAFAPIMQYHSEHNEHREPLADRTPWNVADHTGDPHVLEDYRFHANLRMALIPYLYSTGVDASTTGIPMMRPMALVDERLTETGDQYMLGDSLCVAPVTEPGADGRSVVLPDGDWHDFWTGEPVPSGTSSVDAPPSRIPVFVRDAGIVPMSFTDDVRLGAPAGLPSEHARHVVMIVPSSGARSLVDPVTRSEYRIEVTSSPSELRIRGRDLPRVITLWVRDGGSSTLVDVGPGDVDVDIPRTDTP